MDNTNWTTHLTGARRDSSSLLEHLAALNAWANETTAQIGEFIRAEGAEVDLDAVKAMITRPYTLIPINEHEAWLIQSRAVKMPMVGWLVAQDGAFNKFRVSRSMDLLTPLPTWMKDELNWKPPAYSALVDGTRAAIRVTAGDESAFKRKYGSHLGTKQADGTFKIRGGGAWIKLVASLIRDGILPYMPQPVAAEHWQDDVALAPDLLQVLEQIEWQTKRPFIQRAVDEFVAKGAVLVNYPPGAGKTPVACIILNHFRGRALILADTTILTEQWNDRVKKFAPNADVTISTYQGAAKYLDREWDLIIPDEAQRLPANTFSKLAFAKAKYRLGLTGTPWREDDRQFMITALSGFPVTVRWAELVAAGVLKRPRIIVATVPSDSSKVGYVRQLLAKRKGGRALVFCDWIEQGQSLADALDLPFVHGETSRKLERVLEEQVCVVSRIGDRGLDLPDLKLVVEVAGAGGSREQFAQRVGRLLHGEFAGEFHTVFTPEEAEKFRPRIFGVEVELAGEVDIEFVNVGVIEEPKPRAGLHHRPQGRFVKRPNGNGSKPLDEVDAVLNQPSVARMLEKAYAGATAEVQRTRLIHKVLKLGWSGAISLKELELGRGIRGRMLSNYGAAFKAAERAGLVESVGDGRWMTHKRMFENVVKLAERVRA